MFNLSKKTNWFSGLTKGLVIVAMFGTLSAPFQALAEAQAVPASTYGSTASTNTNSNSGSGSGNNQNNISQESCWSSSMWSICLASVVYVFTVGLMSVFAYIGAFIFNIAVQITLQSVTFSQSFLTQCWAAVRDLANMVFIFLLVYLAITIILQAETAGTLRMLAGIIAAALLINFSFFFTRLIIDGGNILALQFYNAIDAPSLASTGANSTNGSTVSTIQNVASQLDGNKNVKDLTGKIMNVIGVQTLAGSDSFSNFANSNNNWLSKFLILCFVYIAIAVILAMLAFTYIAVGIKFLIRIVVLWFAIIASPLAFVAAALYKGGKADRFGLFKRWMSALVEFSFYPAVFLFLFWIITFFATQLSTGGSIVAATLNDASNASNLGQIYGIATAVSSVCIRLGIIIAMLFMAMKVSDMFAKTSSKAVDSFGTTAAGKVTGWTKPYLRGWARTPVAVAGAGVGFATRNVVGGTANTLIKGGRIGTRYPYLGKDVKGLQKSEFWNKNKGTYYVSDKLQKNFLKPLADQKFFGTSYTEADKASKDRDNERKKNLRSVDVKKIVSNLATEADAFDNTTFTTLTKRNDLAKEVQMARDHHAALNAQVQALGANATQAQRDAVTDANNKLQELLQNQAQLPALTAAEQGQLTELGKQKVKIEGLAREVNSFNKTELESALPKAADVEKIMKYVNEPLAKKIEESDKYNDAEKAKLREVFDTTSRHSPATQAQDEAKKLHTHYEELKRNQGAQDPHMGMRTMDALLRRGQVNNLSSKDIDLILGELKEKMSSVRGMQNNTRQRAMLQQTVTQMQDAAKNLKGHIGKTREGSVSVTI